MEEERRCEGTKQLVRSGLPSYLWGLSLGRNNNDNIEGLMRDRVVMLVISCQEVGLDAYYKIRLMVLVMQRNEAQRKDIFSPKCSPFGQCLFSLIPTDRAVQQQQCTNLYGRRL